MQFSQPPRQHVTQDWSYLYPTVASTIGWTTAYLSGHLCTNRWLVQHGRSSNLGRASFVSSLFLKKKQEREREVSHDPMMKSYTVHTWVSSDTFLQFILLWSLNQKKHPMRSSYIIPHIFFQLWRHLRDTMDTWSLHPVHLVFVFLFFLRWVENICTVLTDDRGWPEPWCVLGGLTSGADCLNYC